MNNFFKQFFNFKKTTPEPISFDKKKEVVKEELPEISSEEILPPPTSPINKEEEVKEEVKKKEEKREGGGEKEVKRGRGRPRKAKMIQDNFVIEKKEYDFPEWLKPSSFYTPPVLNEDERLDLVSKIAMYWKAPKIIAYFEQCYSKSLDESTIHFYKTSKEWALVIDRMRAEYIAGLMEVPIANKRKRLEEFQELYDALKELGEYPRAASILDLVRSEMEEKKGSVQNVYLTQVNVSDEELMQEKIKSLNELEAIRKRKLIGATKGEENVTASQV